MRPFLAAVAMIAISSTTAFSQALLLRVIDTTANDVLNVREFPTVSSRIVGVIPPDARDVEFLLEERNGWLFVHYRRFEGWASARFSAPVAPPVRRGRNFDEDK